MRKVWSAIIALALVVLTATACAEANPTERFAGVWQDPVYGRARLRILQVERADVPGDEPGYDVRLTWGGSADSAGVWTMSARYEAASDALVYEGGTMAYLTYGEGGAIVSEEVRWEDAEGRFAFEGDKLLWTDSREDRAADFAFERLPRLAPDAAALRERFFEPVAGLEPGTAGASLKLAGATAALLGFADEYRVWDADVPALRENLLAAWSGLDDGTRRRFDENLPDVVALMDEAMTDYAPVAGQFEDAGAEYMFWLAGDEEARMSWRALLALIRNSI